MKDKKIVIIGIIIVVLILVMFVITSIQKSKIVSITYDDISDVIEDDDFVFLYNGEITKDVKSFAKKVKNNNRVVTYQIDLSDEEIEELSTDDISIEGTGYIIYVDQELTGFISEDKNDDEKYEYVKKYLYGYIPASERYYQVIDSAETFTKKFNSSDYTIAVFGASSCTYCTLYLPVVNKVAEDYGLTIYYFDEDTYDTNELDTIYDLDITIPSTCTQSGEETTLAKGYDKPLTIITKKGELVGCIKGYVVEDTLLSKLKEFNLVKDGKK
jgi:thiol-disulfide isomerase/thioredoxin